MRNEHTPESGVRAWVTFIRAKLKICVRFSVNIAGQEDESARSRDPDRQETMRGSARKRVEPTGYHVKTGKHLLDHLRPWRLEAGRVAASQYCDRGQKQAEWG